VTRSSRKSRVPVSPSMVESRFISATNESPASSREPVTFLDGAGLGGRTLRFLRVRFLRADHRTPRGFLCERLQYERHGERRHGALYCDQRKSGVIPRACDFFGWGWSGRPHPSFFEGVVFASGSPNAKEPSVQASGLQDERHGDRRHGALHRKQKSGVILSEVAARFFLHPVPRDAPPRSRRISLALGVTHTP
jgi:hypothetical protein